MGHLSQSRRVFWLFVGYLFIAAFCPPPVGNDGFISKPPQSYVFDFQDGLDGFVAGFADLPPNYDPAAYDLNYGVDLQPIDPPVERKALRIEGHNRSDDLFMFVKRRITGLKPDASYVVSFQIEFLSNAPEEAIGIGGGPGTSVFLKAGALSFEPLIVPNNANTLLVVNCDKGNQANGGSDLAVLGDISIPGEVPIYTYKTLSGNAPHNVRTDAKGTCWIIVGTDSGFEGFTRLYYSRITVTFTPQLSRR
jgi:hypothetical protein